MNMQQSPETFRKLFVISKLCNGIQYPLLITQQIQLLQFDYLMRYSLNYISCMHAI